MDSAKLPRTHRNAEKLIELLKTKPESYWIKKGERRALKLFHEMATRVPAYQDFLKKEKISPSHVKSAKDFPLIPPVDKDNYLRKYPLEKLCWDGEFATKHWDISSTSGSTGEPFYFPRSDLQNEQYSILAETYLRTNFNVHRKTTLYINCFALGVWIGGIFTYEAIKSVSENHKYPLTLINPGLNKQEILKSIRSLGPKFDQIIIGGYPPFIRDLIDEGIEHKIGWKDYDLKFIFSAESFSEEFRKYILEKTHTEDYYRSSLNHFGTVDQGTLAYETPLCILLRQIALRNTNFCDSIFRNDITRFPTLAQYDPSIFYFEEENKGLYCSSYSGLPLFRYDLKDFGGIHSSESLFLELKEKGLNLQKEIKEVGISRTIFNLPFVYVYERKNFSVVVSGANVYPETVKKALHDKRIDRFFTGKCTLIVRNHKKNQSQYLEINLELKKNIRKQPSATIKKLVCEVIVSYLTKENSEYHSMFYDQMNGKAFPVIVFWPYKDERYFSGKGKQKWSIKK